MVYAEIARSAAQRATAITDVTRVMDTASGHAREAGLPVIQANARAPFELFEHEPAVVEDFLRWFERTPEWRPDGNCLNRTMVGIHKLDAMSGLHAKPTDDVFAGAIHVEQESADDYLATAATPEERERLRGFLSKDENAHLSGRFHGTMAFKVRGHEDLLAVDFKAKRPLVHFDGDNLPVRTQLIRPFSGTGVWGGVSMRPNFADHTYFDGAKRFLNDAISASTMRIDRSAALEHAVEAVHRGYTKPAAPDVRLMSRVVNDSVTFD